MWQVPLFLILTLAVVYTSFITMLIMYAKGEREGWVKDMFKMYAFFAVMWTAYILIGTKLI